MSDLQKLVQHAIDERVEAGTEIGVQVAVYRHGELIVDAVAGLADPDTGRPVDSGTPFYTWSMGKAMTATIVHILVERGLFGYDTPIADLWPEFGAHGKEHATVRHALTHTAGVPGIGADTTVEDVCDWDRICARVAASEPWWVPGTRTGYHAYTFGFILGEVVRRATGKPISELLREEVGAPLGVADELYFGMPVSEHHRLARLVDAPGGAEMTGSIPPESPMLRASSPELWPTAALGNRTDVLAADIPAGGKMTARAIARMYAALLGEVDGVRLLPPDRVRAILADPFQGTDQVFGNTAIWGLGYGIGRLGGGDDRGVFGMGGAGGTFGYADNTSGVAFALTKNLQTMDFATAAQISGLVADAS
ncbi:MAG TPA: serine hydrolase domain-containing protein [Actinoplanes sp.]|nr:serine hydrolase domain-containing protein [Actinoplanes sp.]